MFVTSNDTNEVLRFNASSGVYFDTFVPAGSGGIESVFGIETGPDINGDGIRELYVVGYGSASVHRYDGATGTPLGTFAVSGAGTLSLPKGITIDASGIAYVASSGSNKIQKYTASTGVYLGSIGGTELSSPNSVTLGSDGLVYVASGGNNRILRYTTSGQFMGDFVPAGSGGLINPQSLAFGPDGDLLVSAIGPMMYQIFRYGDQNEAIVNVTISKPSTLPLTVDFATANGTAYFGTDYSATSGSVTFEPGVTSKVIRVPILDDTPAATEPTETFVINISLNPLNAQAGMVADGQAVVSILDNDPFTKFYVVNDATTDRTYEYQTTGAAVENYVLSGGNTAPRGAASTTMGTTVWVVDANKSVYVYNTSGALQGSWAAGGLQANAALEGIATNGTDVWLVDAQTDKVYRYTNAAGLTSGSQNAASSFSLNSGNTNPKDIVTDGSYLWVVDDSNSDKVFKYTIAGTYVGSWKITTSGAKSPTGITLDPANPSHVWIVDSGADRVYQYDNAVGLTSGSKSANSSWALAASNTNPQGIADPPPPGTSLNAATTAVDIDNEFEVNLLQAPIVTIVDRSSVETVSTLRELSAAKTVAKDMSQTAVSFPAAPKLVSKGMSIPLQSRTRAAESQIIDRAFADVELTELLHQVSDDLFESAIR